jgi:predicted nicotinamide N-methyase
MPFTLHLKQIFIQNLCIELFVPDAEEVQAAYHRGEITVPFWSQIWPAAIGLSEFLLSHPLYIQNKKVLELAAGLGLPSLTAARHATSVISSDYIPEAVDLIQRSAAHNKLNNLSAVTLDLHLLPHNMETDVLLLSDINYTPAVFDLQLELINQFLQKGSIVVLSTPQRLMGKEFIAPLLTNCVQQKEIAVMQGGKEVMVLVIVLQMEIK